MARPSSPSSFGRRTFHFKRCMGTGSFGEVYEAMLSSPGGLERRVAVKLLKQEVANDVEAIERLRDEGMLLSNLDHPHILSVIDLVQIGERRALVTEFIDGEDLLELLRRDEGRMPLRGVLQTGAQVARALDAAWSTLQLIHRDIKPGNIRISRHGIVKLLDFGIARSDQLQRRARTETEVVIGSVPYMAPETFHMIEPTDKLDIFALGCVLFEGLGGERLYARQKRNRVLQLLAAESTFAPYMRERMAFLGTVAPAEVAELVTRCLSWLPDARPTAAELADALERLAALTPGPTLAEWCRTRSWSEPEAVPASLVGREITEGTLTVHTPTGQDTTPRRTRRSWAPLWGLVGAALLLVPCLGVLGYPFIAGQAGQVIPPIETRPPESNTRSPEPTTPPAEPTKPRAEPIPPEPEPVAPEPVAPEPEPVAPEPVTPEPVAPTPTPRADPRPQPTESPRPAPPKPEPIPEADRALVQVYFQNKDGKKFGPDQALPPGPYRIIADFGDGLERVGSAEVAPGQEIKLVCNPRKKSCSLQ